MWRLRNFIDWLVKIYQYALFLRKDYDSDYGSLLELIKFKLQRMILLAKKDKVYVGTDRCIKQMKYAIFLIDRINTDYYFNIMDVYYTERFGTNWSEAMLENILAKPFFIDKNETNAHIRYQKKTNDLYMRLFRHLNKYIRGWWV